MLTEINFRADESDPISIWWLTLIDILQPKSITNAGENMVDLGRSHLTMLLCSPATLLSRAGVYDHSLTIKILESMNSPSAPEKYRFNNIQMQVKLEKAVLHIRHLTKADSDKYMVDNKLTPSAIIFDFTDQ